VLCCACYPATCCVCVSVRVNIFLPALLADCYNSNILLFFVEQENNPNKSRTHYVRPQHNANNYQNGHERPVCKNQHPKPARSGPPPQTNHKSCQLPELSRNTYIYIYIYICIYIYYYIFSGGLPKTVHTMVITPESYGEQPILL